MIARRLILMLVASMLLAACGVENTWVDTKHFAVSAYNSTRDFLNPDPELELDQYHFDNPNQEKLATLFAPVDGPITSLNRYVSDQDRYPKKEWAELLFARYPWVNSVIVADTDGYMLERMPPRPIKRIHEPLYFEAIWRQTFLQPVIDYPELGPELYLGTPYFRDVEFMGLIVASFDPRTLLNFSPNPEELYVIHPGGGVWSVSANVDTAGLLGVPWEEILEDDVTGQVEVNGKYYTWLARYIGNDAFIYATESVDPDY